MSTKKKRSINEIVDESNSNNVPAKKQRLNEQNESKDTEIRGLDENDNIKIKNELLRSGEPIMLNIGGIKYSTSIITLSSDTNSILYKMFDEKWSLKPNKDGSYFIDRNGKHFEHILDFLRNNKLNIPENIYLINHLILEAEYYQLLSLKTALLLKKSGSKILKETDIEFVQKCFKDQYPQCSTINIEKSALIHTGSMWPKYDKLKGLDRLLFLIQSKENTYRFGIFIDSKYVLDDCRDGFVFDLRSNISGRICHHKKHECHSYEKPVFIYPLQDETVYNRNIFRRILRAVIEWDAHDDYHTLECVIREVNKQWIEYQCTWNNFLGPERIICKEEIRQIEIYHFAL